MRLRTRMGIERCHPQRAFWSVPTQAIDEIDDWRVFGLEDILDLPSLAIEWVMIIDLAQFRQDRNQQLSAVSPHGLRELDKRAPCGLECRAVLVVKRCIILAPIRP